MKRVQPLLPKRNLPRWEPNWDHLHSRHKRMWRICYANTMVLLKWWTHLTFYSNCVMWGSVVE